LDPKALELQLKAAERTLSGEILRWIVGKEVKITTKGDVYGRKWDQQSYETELDNVLKREFHKSLIYEAIQAGYTSVRAIGDRTGLELMRISNLLADMEKNNMVAFQGMENKVPVFSPL